MYETNMTIVAAVLVVGLMVGAGLGYYMAPAEQASEYQLIQSYDEGYSDAIAEIGNQPTLPSETTSIGQIEDKVDGLTTLVYGAIGASLVAALAAIVSLMQTTQR